MSPSIAATLGFVAGVALVIAGGGRGLGTERGGALPAVNALLNATSAVLLTAGYRFIRARRVAAHRAAMIAAVVASSLFLITYLVHHAQVGSVPFTGTGWLRAVYFPLLVSHIVLAAAIVPLALVTLYRAWSEDFVRHRRLARITFPIWLYVAASGWLVYYMLYRM